VELRWTSPRRALEDHARGELPLVFPTLRHLDQLSNFATVAGLLGHARGRDLEPVLPKVVLSGETARVILPGEPGYDHVLLG
jgi:hypothetical protein